MHKFLYISLILLTFCFVFSFSSYGQEVADTLLTDSIYTTSVLQDSLFFGNEGSTDTLKSKKNNSIELDVIYSAVDSVNFGKTNKKVFLYKDAKVTYGTMELEAAYIEFDMSTNIVYASGMPDSTGKIVGNPVYKDDVQNLEAKQLRYNFKTKRGRILEVITEQDGGYLHAQTTKKDEYGHIHIKDGKYTTCDAEHPHFYVALTKAVSIPGEKIISGPAYLVFADIPLPIGLPFGFFPNTTTNTSGLLIPQYGEESTRGFYLRNGGYYFAINEYVDLTLTGDIYTNGTWGMRVGTNYRKRYKFNGSFNGRIYKNITSEKGLDDYSKSSDYSIMWNHAQDSKANPSQRFSASVNMSTSRFDQNHSRVLTNALTNTKSSSISFQKSWPGSPFNFSASANHTQNSNTGGVNLNLPKMSFNMSRIYPFRFKNATGKGGFWEDIQLSYSSSLDNRISTIDTLLFTSSVFSDMKNGYKHSIPITWNYKPKRLKNFTFSPNLSYNGVAYTEHYLKSYQMVYHESVDSSYYSEVTDTIKGLTYAHSYYPSVSASLSPKIYGMYQFKENSKLQAIRHVMSPTVSFSYIPDVSSIVPEYYRDLYDENGEWVKRYSIYEGSIYGTPTLGSSSKTMSFALRNTIEAKVKSKSDTATELKKINLLDNLNFSTNMNFDDSIKFRPISFNGSTRIFNNKVNISFRGNMDPYALDSLYKRINVSEYSKSGKLVRLTSAGLTMGLNLKGGSGKSKDDAEGGVTDETISPGAPGSMREEYDAFDEDYYYGEYVDFSIPWSLRVDYSLNYTKTSANPNVVQTVSLTGDFSLTPKWKIGFNTGYDLKLSKVTTTNMSIYRDLHCWEMKLTAVPFGIYKSFNFQINAKSSLLQDLKYNKRIPWQDNF
ncbi:MAG: LPS-assembly protein LptD [Bacteroidales bacterium]|nr:LPS-assembly protein LptD [Bacteroidales bacterium]